MFKIILKGSEFIAQVNSEKKLTLTLVENSQVSYILNKEEQRLEQTLEDKRLLIINLSKDDVESLENIRMQIIGLIKNSVDLMTNKKDTVTVIMSNERLIALPSSVYENIQKSPKFLEGFLYVINKQLGTDYTYDELQELLNLSNLRFELVNAKYEGNTRVYETSYDKLLEHLAEEE